MPFFVVHIHEVRDQQRDVVCTTVAERRYCYRQHVEPVKQVFTECLLSHSLGQILICRSNDPDIYRLRIFSTDSDDFFCLQNAQQCGLYGVRHVSYLIEENSAAVSHLEFPRTSLFLGPCERALFIAEQLAFHEAVRYSCTVDRDERSACDRAGIVYGLSDQLLAGAAFAQDQHIGIVLRCFFACLDHPLHRLRTADYRGKSVLGAEAADAFHDLIEHFRFIETHYRAGDIAGAVFYMIYGKVKTFWPGWR